MSTYGNRYLWAEAMLDMARSPDAGKPVCNNTRLFWRGDRMVRGCDIALRLHDTDVVTYHGSGSYTLDSGGWRTVTTKARITEYSPARIYSKRGVWYLNDRLGDPVLFVDGMTIDADGFPARQTNEELAAQIEYESDVAVMNRRINEYVKGYVGALQAGMPAPGGGDCWYCLFMDDTDNAAAGHLEDHIDEGYFVPSLAVTAMRAAGYRDAGIAMLLNYRQEPEGIGGRGEYSSVKRAIAKYLRKRLLPSVAV